MPLWGGTGRALRRYRRAAAAYRRALAPWQEEADALRAHLTTATTFAGATAADEPSVPLQLAPGERVFSVLERASLVEPRNRPERWAAGYTGFSFRLARGVRYRPATTERKKEQGEEAPAAVDKGMATITDQRVVFHGSRRNTCSPATDAARSAGRASSTSAMDCAGSVVSRVTRPFGAAMALTVSAGSVEPGWSASTR